MVSKLIIGAIALAVPYVWRLGVNLVKNSGDGLAYDFSEVLDDFACLWIHSMRGIADAHRSCEKELEKTAARLWDGVVSGYKSVKQFFTRVKIEGKKAWKGLMVNYTDLIDPTETASVLLAKKLSADDEVVLANTWIIPNMLFDEIGKAKLLKYMMTFSNPCHQLLIDEGVIGLRSDGYYHVLRSYINHMNNKEPVNYMVNMLPDNLREACKKIDSAIEASVNRTCAQRVSDNMMYSITEDDIADAEENIYRKAMSVYCKVDEDKVSVDDFRSFEDAIARYFTLDSTNWINSDHIFTFCRKILVAADVDFSEEELKEDVNTGIPAFLARPIIKDDTPAFLKPTIQPEEMFDLDEAAKEIAEAENDGHFKKMAMTAILERRAAEQEVAAGNYGDDEDIDLIKSFEAGKDGYKLVPVHEVLPTTDDNK